MIRPFTQALVRFSQPLDGYTNLRNNYMIAAFKRVPGQPVMIRNTSMALLAIGLLAVSVSTSEAGARKDWRNANASISSGHSFSGIASFYGNESGSKTASGQRFNQNAMTAAHRSLPFGTRLKVTHSGRSVVVTVNDRGPFIKGRVLDLSTGAARAIGLTSRGVGQVVAEVQ
jgi:rare lipoprotein A